MKNFCIDDVNFHFSHKDENKNKFKRVWFKSNESFFFSIKNCCIGLANEILFANERKHDHANCDKFCTKQAIFLGNVLEFIILDNKSEQYLDDECGCIYYRTNSHMKSKVIFYKNNLIIKIKIINLLNIILC